MTGFSAEWLALREEVDHASRNPHLARQVADHLKPFEAPLIVDLGCGTGSNLRALAPQLGLRQHWCLVDLDAALLDIAAQHLAHWADFSEKSATGLTLYWDEQVITVEFQQADINKDLEILLRKQPQLITAAAFFDLVSARWIKDFAQHAAMQQIPFYTVLTYDGEENWQPPYPSDGAVLAAFHRHQATDKGFGPSAGPQASHLLQQAFSAHGYEVMNAASPWVLNAQDHPGLMLALGKGIGEAASVFATPEHIDIWRDALHYRRHAVIGHQDLFARPVIS